MIDFFVPEIPLLNRSRFAGLFVASIEPRSCNGCGQWCGQCLRLVGRLPA